MVKHIGTIAMLYIALTQYNACIASEIAIDAAKRNLAALQGFDNISFKYTIESNRVLHGVKQNDCRYEYQRFANNFRIKWHNGNKWLDNVVLDHASVMSLSNLSGNKVTDSDRFNGAIESYQGTPLSHGDPWFDFLFVYPNPGKLRPSSMYDIFKKITSTETDFKGTISTANINNQASSYLVVRIDNLNTTEFTEIWFDKERNYLISKLKTGYTFKKRNELNETRIEKFAEPAPGIYFPAIVVVDKSIEGKETKTTTYKCKDIQLNQLDEHSLDLNFPANTLVLDVQGNRRYTVGPNGERLNETTYDLKPIDTNTGLPAEKNPEPEPQPQPVTTTEPINLSKFFLTITLLVAIITASVALFIRIRTKYNPK